MAGTVPSDCWFCPECNHGPQVIAINPACCNCGYIRSSEQIMTFRRHKILHSEVRSSSTRLRSRNHDAQYRRMKLEATITRPSKTIAATLKLGLPAARLKQTPKAIRRLLLAAKGTVQSIFYRTLTIVSNERGNLLRCHVSPSLSL